MSAIIAFSDVHLGYDQSDCDAFLTFLDELQGRDDIGDVVVIGDYVDLWRRDVVGLEFELSKYMEELKALKKKATVHYVVGNHDFHVKGLENHDYPFMPFQRSLKLDRLGHTLYFIHGDQCDPVQNEAVSEFFCWTLSDNVGEWKSKLWDIFGSLISVKSNLTKDEFQAKIETLMTPPEDNLRKAAFGKPVDYVKCLRKYLGMGDNEFLVFGHTHKAFIDLGEQAANTGCWIKGAHPTNTYFELGKSWPPSIVQFHGGKLASTSLSMLRF